MRKVKGKPAAEARNNPDRTGGGEPSPGAGRGGKSETTEDHADVLMLADDLQNAVRRLLVEGATFEDVEETLHETCNVRITRAAVARYFRTNPELQRERIANQRIMAKKFVESLGDDVDSAQSDLALSVFLTGLSGLNRRNEATRIKNAIQIMKDQKDERYRKADARRKDKKLRMEQKESSVRVKALQTRLDVATFQLDRLRQSIERQGKDKTLGPEIIQQINELYGIVTAPNPEEGSGETKHDRA